MTPFAPLMTACRLLEIDLLATIPLSECEPIVERAAPGGTIKQFRERRGLTLDAFNERVGTERAGATIIGIGDRRTLWPFDVIALVADALEIDCRCFVKNPMWRRG